MLICSITTWGESLNKLITGKCFSIQILENLPKRKYFQGKCKVIQLQKLQSHPTISLDNIQVETASYVKHLGILLDEKLNSKQHIHSVILKINKGISVIKKTQIFIATKILADNLQILFATPNWLWKYHLRPTTKWIFLW